MLRRGLEVVLLFFWPSVLNSRGYKILKSKQVRVIIIIIIIIIITLPTAVGLQFCAFSSL